MKAHLRVLVAGTAFLAACGGLLAACGSEPDGGAGPAEAPRPWRVVAEEHLDAMQQAQRDRALAARTAMFGRLFRALADEMQRTGPAGAIAVCKERAPQIAAATAQEHGVRIGRTSFRLRNLHAKRPDWVGPLTADRPETPRFAAGPRRALAVLLPIRVQAACLTCHGPLEQIPEDVRTRLAEAYPDDMATGFRDGDLRGWFWVEVPAAP